MHRSYFSLVSILVGTLLAFTASPSRAADGTSAERALLDGRVDEAVSTLRAVTSSNSRDGAAHLLLCRAFFSEDLVDEAVSECEAAINNGGANDSSAQDWMGRAYGRKADRANALTAFNLARRVKVAFERAVQLDPANTAAVNDLSEYYVGAPSIVGGGLDKAADLAQRVQASMPSSAHRTRGLLAEKQGNYTQAEQELRAAIVPANKAAGWTDLGHFYARRKQQDKAVATLRKAIEVNTAHDSSLVDVASILIEMHREPRLAQDALRAYLASGAKNDDAPAFRAHTLLGQSLADTGDKPAARSEFQAALALASNYSPARKGLKSL